MVSAKTTLISTGFGLMFALTSQSTLAIDAKQLTTSPLKAKPLQQLTANLQKPMSKMTSFTANGIQWKCQTTQCKANAKWPRQAVNACKDLVKKTGKISKFYLAKHSLNASQLQQCNSAASQSANKKHKVHLLTQSEHMPSADKPAPKPASKNNLKQLSLAANTHEIKQLPGVNKDPGVGIRAPGLLPGRQTDDGRPSNRDAANAIREAAAARATQGDIRSVSPVESSNRCVRDVGGRPSEFVLTGSRFGATASGRKITLATAVRNTVIADADIVSWSDTRIVARLPYHHRSIRDGQRYVVGIRDNRNRWVSNINREIVVCPRNIVVTGQLSLDHCAAGLSNVKVGLTVNGRPHRDINVTGVPGDSFRMQYEINLPAEAEANLELTPKLVGVSCPGGAWTPLNKRLTLGFNSRTRASQNFDYHVGLQRLSIPMTAIARIVQDKFVGMSMRLNNYDAATRDRKSNDTVLRMPRDLGGEERIYDIPPVVRNPRTYYVNDINLNNVIVRPTATGLKLTLSFENAGTEFLGFCRPSNAGEEINCALGAPDVQANLSVDIFLTLERYYSRGAPVSISFGDVRVVANPNAQAGGVCGAIDVCDLFTDYKRQIKRAIEANLRAALDTTAVRDQVANALLSTLRGLSIGRVNSAGVEGRNFVIRYIPAE